MLSASDASAKLVELCKAESLGVFDHHQYRVGHVDPTSITVVDISIEISLRTNPPITASFSDDFIRPWSNPSL